MYSCWKESNVFGKIQPLTLLVVAVACTKGTSTADHVAAGFEP